MRTLKGPNGLVIELDKTQIFPSDPGQGTPVLVSKGGKTASWNVACDMGELNSDYKLTQSELDYLERMTPLVESWMNRHGV